MSTRNALSDVPATILVLALWALVAFNLDDAAPSAAAAAGDATPMTASPCVQSPTATASAIATRPMPCEAAARPAGHQPNGT